MRHQPTSASIHLRTASVAIPSLESHTSMVGRGSNKTRATGGSSGRSASVSRAHGQKMRRGPADVRANRSNMSTSVSASALLDGSVAGPPRSPGKSESPGGRVRAAARRWDGSRSPPKSSPSVRGVKGSTPDLPSATAASPSVEVERLSPVRLTSPSSTVPDSSLLPEVPSVLSASPTETSETASFAAPETKSSNPLAATAAAVAVNGDPEPPLTEGLTFTEQPVSLPGLPAGARVRHVDTNGRYVVAKAATAGHVLVWRLDESDGATTAHAMRSIPLPVARVDCLTLQDAGGHLLVTCAHNILLWDLSEPDKPAVTLGEDFGGVSCCHLSAGGEAAVACGAAVLALGVARSVWLLDAVRVRHVTTLRGHECDVTAVTVQGGLCAAGSEAGHVKVWELSSGSVLFSWRSPSPRPTGALSLDSTIPLLAAGCGSRITAAAAAAAGEGRWTAVATADLHQPATDGGGRSSPRPECAVLAVRLLRRPSAAVFGPDWLLLVVTTGGLTVLNARTWLPVHTAAIAGDEPWGGGAVALTPGGSGCAALVCGRGALRGQVTAVRLEIQTRGDVGETAERMQALSIVCRDPLPPRSVLRAPRTSPTGAGRSAGPATSRVRSSGYGTPPRRTMFQPRTSTGRGRTAKAVSSKLSLSSLPTVLQRPSVRPRDRPADRPAAHYQCHVMPAPEASRPQRILRDGDTLLRIALSGSGRHLACTSQQGAALEVARLQGLHVQQDQFLLGTQGAITSVAWSLSGRRLAAVSAAGVQLWTFPGGDQCWRRPVGGGATFSAAQFFFTDEFLLACRGDTAELSRLPPEGTTAAGGGGHSSSSGGGGGVLRPVLACRLPCRALLHVAGACQLRSALAVACCSDRALRLVDVQAGRVALTVPDAHRRPPHAARLCEGSPHLPAALPLYDLVGSAAVGDGVRLWDVRSGRLAARFAAEGELRALPAGFQVSPCGRLVALGADGAHVTLWDIRSARGPLARLRTAAAGVSDVAFHPRRPALVAALLDGRVQTWPLDGGGGGASPHGA